MLAGDRASKLLDERGDFFRDAAHTRYTLGLAGVEGGPHVQRADAGVAVEAGPGSVAMNDLLEARDELLQPSRRNGGVLDEGDGLFGVVRAQK